MFHATMWSLDLSALPVCSTTLRIPSRMHMVHLIYLATFHVSTGAASYTAASVCRAMNMSLPAAGDPLEVLPSDPIRWVHVPKTGTSFRILLEEFGHKCTWSASNSHSPLRDAGTKNIVLFAREPLERVASAFCHMQHAHEWVRQEVIALAGTKRPRVRCDSRGLYVERKHGLRTRVPSDLVLLYAEGVMGCEVAMLTGAMCNIQSGFPGGYSSRQPHRNSTVFSRAELAARLKLAVELVRNATFVGLTHRWNESVCLWRSKFGVGNRSDFTSKVFSNSRPGDQNCTRCARNVLKQKGWADQFDGKLFQAASARFERDIDLEHAKQSHLY